MGGHDVFFGGGGSLCCLQIRIRAYIFFLIWDLRVGIDEQIINKSGMQHIS